MSGDGYGGMCGTASGLPYIGGVGRSTVSVSETKSVKKSIEDQLDEALQIHLEEMGFGYHEDADYNARIIRTIVMGIVRENK